MIALFFASVNGGAAQVSDAYVNQVDPSSRGQLGRIESPPAQGGAYIMQLPESARPVPPPRPVVRREPSAPQVARTIEPQVRGPVFPNVGAGVALALSQTQGAEGFPNVGAGVGVR